MNLLRFLLLVSAPFFVASESHASSYVFSDLGTIGGSVSYAAGINDLGQIVGRSSINLGSSSPLHAALWNGSIATDLGTLGGSSSFATAINNAGQVVGQSAVFGDAKFLATLWSGPTATTISPTSSLPNAINNYGQIAGMIAVQNGVWDWWWRPSIWSGTTVTILDTLAGATHTEALAINNRGVAVGRSLVDPFDGHYHATVWNGTIPSDLGIDSSAYAINDYGIIAGSSNVNGALGGVGTHATVWNDSIASDLGTLGGSRSEARAINNAGMVVGYSLTTGDESYHAALWNEGKPIDLNSLLDERYIGDGWVLTDAMDINESGWIVGEAHNFKSGETHAYLLSVNSVPEPGAYSMFLLGIGLMSAVVRRTFPAIKRFKG